MYEPTRVGTPLIVPSELTFKPAGMPPVADHVYGARPPVASSVERNASPTSADVRDALAASATTLSVNSRESTRVTLWMSLDVAVMVNVDVPAVVGVPEIVPVFGSSVSPAGNDPAVTVHVTTVVG